MALSRPIVDDGDLAPIEPVGYYHYNIVLIEKFSSPKNYIKNATVIYGEDGSNFTHSDELGRASWYSSDYRCPCKVTAQGYETMDDDIMINHSVATVSHPYEIYLIPKTANFHYKLIILDETTHAPIEGASISIGNAEPEQHDVTLSDGSFIYCSDLSTVEFTVKKNGYRTLLHIHVDGKNSISAAQNSPTIMYMKSISLADYYYALVVKDNTGSPVSGVKFKFYKDFGYETLFSPTEYVTDTNGLIASDRYNDLHVGNLDYTPIRLYVKGTYIPLNYTWGSSQTGILKASLSQFDPGCTITVQSNTESETFYYNIKLEDEVTGTPVSGATVSYLEGNTVKDTITTNENGVTRYSSGLRTMTVKISKIEYSTGYENGITYDGSSDPTSCRLVKVYPKNTIQVMYKYGDDDLRPAPNKMVKVFTYDNIGNYMLINTFTTNSNGYISNLNDSYYTAGSICLSVVGYTNVYLLTPGKFVIKLAPPTEDDTPDDEDSNFELYNDFSANGIKKKLEKGNAELKSTGVSDKVSYNTDDFRIKILDPESVTTLDIFTSVPVMMQDDQKSVIGSVDISLKPDVNDLRLKVINRYSGYYNPIFKDVLFYNNLSKQNGDEFPYSNVSFDYNYNDNYGKFGYINNLWFHKVNDNKEMEIIKTLTPYYPLTGQYAIDFKDFNVFGSNWDMNYYTRQIDVEHSEPCQNISSMKNKPSMFGSKYLNVPKRIEITGLSMGNDKDWYGEWNDDWITNPDGCPGEMMYKEINDNSVDFYFFLKKRILRYFYDKLYDVFNKNIEANQFSFGKQGLEDDIYEYVTKNVLKLYRLEKVRVFVRRTKKGRHNSRIENDYTSYLDFEPGRPDKPITVEYLKNHGFVEIKNVTLTKMNRDDFDRKLVYNLYNGAEEKFGFSFVLKKI